MALIPKQTKWGYHPITPRPTTPPPQCMNTERHATSRKAAIVQHSANLQACNSPSRTGETGTSPPPTRPRLSPCDGSTNTPKEAAAKILGILEDYSPDEVWSSFDAPDLADTTLAKTGPMSAKISQTCPNQRPKLGQISAKSCGHRWRWVKFEDLSFQ